MVTFFLPPLSKFQRSCWQSTVLQVLPLQSKHDAAKIAHPAHLGMTCSPSASQLTFDGSFNTNNTSLDECPRHRQIKVTNYKSQASLLSTHLTIILAMDRS